ncbi:MAG: Ig-like domain-containing protein [Lachnospiraceae bacterium]|nr:Ig-like domain-containing protein [Lachnospiraceae bacterium]
MRKKALSLLMAAVMLATTPASMSLASDSASSDTLVVSEAESETSAGEAAEEDTEPAGETTEAGESAEPGKAAEVESAAAAEENEGDAASESVGTDEEPGVSVEETEADAAEAAEAGETTETSETTAESEETANAGDTTADADEEAVVEDGTAAAGLEAAVAEVEPEISFDWDNMVTDYTLFAGSRDTITLEVLVSSYTGTLSYQWYDDEGEAFPGETGSTFTVSVPKSADYLRYYCRVTAANSEGDSTSTNIWFYITTTENLLLNYTYSNAVAPGGSTTLSVDVQSMYSAISYQWYDGDLDEAIAGATSSTLRLSDITSPRSYYCVVTDGVSTDTAYFYVYIDSGLSVTYVDGSYDRTITPGESIALSVSAATNYGPLAYQWYQYQEDIGYTEVNGATSASYRVSTEGYYYCIVSDSYNTYYIDFYVTMESGLTVESDLDYEIGITPGSSATLYVTAASDYSPITYQWYHFQNDRGYTAVSGATSASFTVSEAGRYYCEVSDGYSTKTRYFYVTIDSGLSVNYDSTVYAVEGGTAVMTVYATVDYGSLSYEWYYYDSMGNQVNLGGSGNWLEVTDPSENMEYICRVSDDYGNTWEAWFEVEFVETLTVSYNSSYTVDPNENVTLSVQAVSPNGPITYQWYVWVNDEDGYEEISGATTATCVAMPTSSYGAYECVVSDGVSTKYVYIGVEVDTGISVTADQTGYMVLTGDSVTLSVSATTNYGTLSYSWYYDDENGERIDAGNAASLTLRDLTTTRYYYCHVSDGILSRTITFKVAVVSEIGETAESFSEAKTMTAGTSQTATITSGGAYMYFKIVPTESATYTFYTSDTEDTCGYLYDASKELLKENDDSEEDEDLNFRITYTLTAGATYYLAVRYYSSYNVGTFEVYSVAGNSSCSHTETTHVSAKAATCTSAGNIEYWICDDCGAKFSDSALTIQVYDVTIAATGHSWNAGTVTQAATCTTAGIKTCTCTVCGATKTETIAATGHKSVTHTAAKAATCAATGNIEYWYCADCGKYFSNSALTAEVSAGSLTTAKLTTHTYGAWTTTTAATALATGAQTRTCSVCGQTETQTIAKLTPTITVNATSIKLKKKQSTTALKVSGLAEGDSVASWKSSNTKIVTVTSKGKITAKSKTGTAYITITLKSGLTKKVKVTVQKSAVKTTKITVPSKTVSIKKGKTYTIKPTISPITSVQKVTYSSSNKKVATVNSKGKITAKKKGTATITVKSGSKSVKIKVTVK